MDAIAKLQPHRTMSLQGFDRYGASAALHSASETGFKVSGIFRDAADFAVLVLHDADDFFGHPRFKYLPDADLAGLQLTFDVHYEGLQTINSPKWPSVDWRALNGRRPDGTEFHIDLRPHMTKQAGDYTAASAQFQVSKEGAQEGDKVSLWYQNAAFEATYHPPQSYTEQLTCTFAFWWQPDTNYVHGITAGERNYNLVQGGRNAYEVAQDLAALVNADPDRYVDATVEANNITLTLRAIHGAANCTASDGNGSAELIRLWPESQTLSFWWQADAGFVHYIWVNPGPFVRKYELVQGGRNSFEIAADLAALVNDDPDAWIEATADQNNITVTLKAELDGVALIGAVVDSSDWNMGGMLHRESPGSSPAQDLADKINNADWAFYGVLIPLEAEADGDLLTVRAKTPGPDGNMIRLYSLSSAPDRLFVTPGAQNLSGGLDNATWRVSIDFSDPALNIGQAQRLWLTFAPALENGAAYQPTEWEATFTNWAVAGANRALKVAGPGSVRIEETDAWVKYAGFWEDAPEAFGFFSQGRAKRAASSAAAVTIETHCGHVHDVLVGTRLDYDCGIVEARLDGAGAWVSLDCFESAGLARTARRRVFQDVPAGKHSVEIRLTGLKNPSSMGWYFYFDFLECAVRTDVPDPPEARADIAVATDYDTDHTYKLSPQRLVWAIRKLGMLGPIDHYAGVFWWKQARPVGAVFPSVSVTYSGAWSAGEEAWLTISGLPFGKSVFAGDTPETIASHFAAYINESAVGVWAAADGPTVTITARSPAWTFVFEESHTSNEGTVEVDDSEGLEHGTMPTWTIDPAQVPVLNRGFRDWHTDFFRELRAAGMSAVVSFSQELVHAPDDPGSGEVWHQRFPDQAAVQTATGFGGLYSAHCALSGAVQTYLRQAHEEMAGLMEAAGLVARLQFGEVLWWYQANASGMAFYDADTAASFQASHGRPLHHFFTVNDDPAVNGGVDAAFLQERLRAYVEGIRAYVLVRHPAAWFELLWPLDVNHPETKRLNWFVNLPGAWKQKEGSGFDSFLVEGFQFAGENRNLDQVARCAAYPFRELGWHREDCGYLMGIFNAGWPWERDFLVGRRSRTSILKIWAFDHLCLYGRGVPFPAETRAAAVFRAGA